MRTLRAGFTGYYGMGNFGDDLFGAVCTAAARQLWHAQPLVVGPRLDGVDAGCTVASEAMAARYGDTGAAGKGIRLLSFCRGVLGSDVLVLGGGSVITGRESFRKPLMLGAQRMRGLSLAAVGVSVDPFRSEEARRRVAEFLGRFAYISVRDRRSFELVSSLGLETTLHAGRDLAGMLPLLSPRPPKTPRLPGQMLTLGVSPCNYSVRPEYPAPEPAQWEDALIDALVELAPRLPLQVKVFSLNRHPRHGDEALATDLQRRLQAKGLSASTWFYRDRDPVKGVAAIAECDAMVSARLHGAIVAYMEAVPLVMVDYHRKCRDFADDIGLPGSQRITGQSHDRRAWTRALHALLDGSAEPRVSREVYARQAQQVFKCAPWSADRD